MISVTMTVLIAGSVFSQPTTPEPSPFVGPFEQRSLELAWKSTGAAWPADLRFYRMERASQMLVIQDGRPHRGWYAASYDLKPETNSNRKAPWRVPGGLDGVDSSLWQSHKAVYLPDGEAIEWHVADVGVPNAGRRLPKMTWEYPVGTITAEMLTNANGQPFEIRTRTKMASGWVAKVAWRSVAARPAGYNGVQQSCASCHDKAGSSETYGITVSGSDTVFSLHHVHPASISRFQVAPEPRLSGFWPLRERK